MTLATIPLSRSGPPDVAAPTAAVRDETPAPPRQSEGRVRRSLWRRIIAEPLTHFVLLGLVLFAVAHWLDTRSSRYLIRLGPAERHRLALSYAQQYGQPPSAGELRTMVDDAVRQEILLREGLALGLDKDDEIVRRRIAQKFQFLMEDGAAVPEPSDADLRRWYATHGANYALPPRRSFDHLYFAIDQRGESAARALAQAALTSLRAGKAAPATDAFPGPDQARLLSAVDTERLFGGEGFARNVFAARPETWSGPYRSAFGWHLVRVNETAAASPRDFAAVREQVRNDWVQARQGARNAAAFAEIRRNYRVEGLDSPP